MTGTLKVKPQNLISASTEFNNSASRMQTITGEMMSIVRSTTGAWQGEAQSTYNNSFNQLDDDMQKLYRLVSEHSTDLNDMAQEYIRVENLNQQAAAALPKDVL